MNKKGFTLVEVLTVIIILSIILVAASPSIYKVYRNSQLKSEQIFVNRLSTIIDSYIKLNTDTIGFNREEDPAKKDNQNVIIYRGRITINDIIKDNLLSLEDYINAGNKDIQCSTNAIIDVYKDSDFVYCHKVKKETFGCLTKEYEESINGEYIIDTCIWSR